jgi:hypothetical protein
MTLAAYHIQVQDGAGNAVGGAHVEIRREVVGQPLAAPYGDRAGTVPLGNPFDVDASGFAICYLVGGTYQVRVYTGSSGAPTFEAPLRRYVAVGLNAESDGFGVLTKRTVTAAGGVTVASDDVDEIIIDKTVAAATAVTLPAASTRSKAVRIIDGKGDAENNNITIVPASGEKIYGIVNYQAVINGNGGSLTLTPRAEGTGWY